jgi:hypothetical protein
MMKALVTLEPLAATWSGCALARSASKKRCGTRRTELTEDRPMLVVRARLGNSQAVVANHYLQVTDEPEMGDTGLEPRPLTRVAQFGRNPHDFSPIFGGESAMAVSPGVVRCSNRVVVKT